MAGTRPASPDTPPAGLTLPGVVRLGGRVVFKTLGQHVVFLPIVLRVSPEGRSRRITADTDVVVEGLPRSGNTFAAHALRVASDRPVSVASHVHVPAQVQLAVRRGLPTIVTIREPVAATTSHLAAVPHLTPKRALREYVAYCRAILPLVDDLVLADFEEITSDFGPVIERVNRRFGSDFSVFEATPANVEAVTASMDRDWEQNHAGRGRDSWQPRPDSTKEERKQASRSLVEEPDLAPLVDEAGAVYRALTDARMDQIGRLSPP
jgi:hypothetical protein